MKRIVLTSLSTGLLALSGCSFLGFRGGYEEAGFTGSSKKGAIELRDYQELVLVETVVQASYRDAGNQAFRRLFAYISGENTAREKIPMTTPVFASESTDRTNEAESAASPGEKIAMTAPVFAEAASEDPASPSWRYAFVLPSTYTLDTAPLPKDPSVQLTVKPAGTMAVHRYNGRWNEKKMRRKIAELEQWISEQGLTAMSAPRSAAYDPPWTLPPLRRNEVMIEVSSAPR